MEYFLILQSLKNKIDSPQKVELFPINNSLKKYPENKAPMAKIINGIIIIKGASCVFSIGIDLLLYDPKKVLKTISMNR